MLCTLSIKGSTSTMSNDWDIIDPDNEWGFTRPDSETGPRMDNLELRKTQGLNENERPNYGELVQTLIIHRKFQEMTIFFYSSGWQESWYWRHCAGYRYRAGYWVDKEWYPPDWDDDESNDVWVERIHPSYQTRYPKEDEFGWD